jgi:hypothetical protein
MTLRAFVAMALHPSKSTLLSPEGATEGSRGWSAAVPLERRPICTSALKGRTNARSTLRPPLRGGVMGTRNHQGLRCAAPLATIIGPAGAVYALRRFKPDAPPESPARPAGAVYALRRFMLVWIAASRPRWKRRSLRASMPLFSTADAAVAHTEPLIRSEV